MNRLEIKVDGEDIEGGKMLRLALNILKVLKDIEKNMAREHGEKPSILWRVDMMSGFFNGLIAIRGEAKSGKDADKGRVSFVAAEAIRRLNIHKEADDE